MKIFLLIKAFLKFVAALRAEKITMSNEKISFQSIQIILTSSL